MEILSFWKSENFSLVGSEQSGHQYTPTSRQRRGGRGTWDVGTHLTILGYQADLWPRRGVINDYLDDN